MPQTQRAKENTLLAIIVILSYLLGVRIWSEAFPTTSAGLFDGSEERKEGDQGGQEEGPARTPEGEAPGGEGGSQRPNDVSAEVHQ